jgi:hypothetical protein
MRAVEAIETFIASVFFCVMHTAADLVHFIQIQFAHLIFFHCRDLLSSSGRHMQDTVVTYQSLPLYGYTFSSHMPAVHVAYNEFQIIEDFAGIKIIILHINLHAGAAPAQIGMKTGAT